MYVYVYAAVERTLVRIINAGINPDGRKCIDGARGYRMTERTFLESVPSLTQTCVSTNVTKAEGSAGLDEGGPQDRKIKERENNSSDTYERALN